MNRRHILMFILIAALILPTTSFGDKAMQLHVNKKLVQLGKVYPTILDDTVWVPARQFAENIGAKVQWNNGTSTLTISGGGNIGVIQVGNRFGRIRGNRIGFPYAPYFNNGQVYAPMQFFNQMFDQAWYWDPYYRQFYWVPIFPRWHGGMTNPPYELYKPPSQPVETTAPPSNEAIGVAVRAMPQTDTPRLVVTVGGKTVTYGVAPDAVILRGAIGYQAFETPLGNIRPGDKLTLQFDDQARVSMVRAQYEVMSGTVKQIAGNTILLATGYTMNVTPHTKILVGGNQACCIQDVHEGDTIVASVGPVDGSVDVLEVQTAAPTAPGSETQPPSQVAPAEGAPTSTGDDQISLNTLGPLRAGDLLVVTFKAEAGGEAWFTVPGAAANIQMAEHDPGTYVGQYTVKQGDIVIAQPVRVMFQAKGGATYTKETSRLITARTIAGYLPRITSPRQGEQIISPVVVSGEAEPGTWVRVVIDFRRVVETVMPITGTTDIQDVRADENGHWQTPPMSAVMPESDSEMRMPIDLGAFGHTLGMPEEKPTIYTISAISIGPNGQENRSYSVDVTKKPGVAVEG